MSKATYLRHGRGQSLNSIKAKDEGRLPASYFAKELGQGITAADIINACGKGEWHHTGAFASRTNFYEIDDIEDNMEAIIDARDARKAKLDGVKTGIATIKFVEFTKHGRKFKAHKIEFTGEATLKGDWVTFGGQRKNITANSFTSLTWNNS